MEKLVPYLNKIPASPVIVIIFIIFAIASALNKLPIVKEAIVNYKEFATIYTVTTIPEFQGKSMLIGFVTDRTERDFTDIGIPFPPGEKSIEEVWFKSQYFAAPAVMELHSIHHPYVIGHFEQPGSLEYYINKGLKLIREIHPGKLYLFYGISAP